MTDLSSNANEESRTDFLKTFLQNTQGRSASNEKIFSACGIRNFFTHEDDYQSFLSGDLLDDHAFIDDRDAFGDFQTSNTLADKVVDLLLSRNLNPDFIIEPTCGQGSFIIAALKSFRNIRKIFGIEIYQPYIWKAKIDILRFSQKHSLDVKPEIVLFHANIFDFDFTHLVNQCQSGEVLVLGNPPWVTNAMLAGLASDNLPAKSNFRKRVGLDAVMGKGNFDIGESVTARMIEYFQELEGNVALIVKNSVIRNIVWDQRQRKYQLGAMCKYAINSKKEFNASVDAALFTASLNVCVEYSCSEYSSIDDVAKRNQFGWLEDKFVSELEMYRDVRHFDGVCPFEWRQGVKHDCSSVMELTKVNSHYMNGDGEEFRLEEDLLYGILKSSHLKDAVISAPKMFIIMTQHKVGQDTAFIEHQFPETFAYLSRNKARFDQRKSMIYRDKPPFSIFGVGDYSFRPFKVCISGLYKQFRFNLILPDHNKPLMLDDTCYFLGFDSLSYAAYTQVILNSEQSKKFLRSITFPDAKRTFTKEVLMRIDLRELSEHITKEEVAVAVAELNRKFELTIGMNDYADFLCALEKPMHP
jgi:hypothetical protein